MNTLMKWNPLRSAQPDFFREMEEMQNRILGLWPKPLAFPKIPEEAMISAEWMPATDVTEDDKEYLIKTELPDVKKEAVKVTAKDGVLTIAGEKRMEKEEKDKKYHRIERAYGTFQRCFTIPEDADADKVVAEFKEGVLTVHLPKKPAAHTKAVEVKIQ